jgi:hypothetical protein
MEPSRAWKRNRSTWRKHDTEYMITGAISSVEGNMSESGREEQERAYPNEPVKKRTWECPIES